MAEEIGRDFRSYSRDSKWESLEQDHKGGGGKPHGETRKIHHEITTREQPPDTHGAEQARASPEGGKLQGI